MSQFTTRLIVEPIGEKTWKLIEGFEYHVGIYPSDDIIKVPADFITDFASVPRIFWPILPPTGSYGKAAVIHDYCYTTALYPRSKCDKIFLEAMEVLKVKKWKRKSMYWAVNLFGILAWRKHRKRDKENKI